MLFFRKGRTGSAIYFQEPAMPADGSIPEDKYTHSRAKNHHFLKEKGNSS